MKNNLNLNLNILLLLLLPHLLARVSSNEYAITRYLCFTRLLCFHPITGVLTDYQGFTRLRGSHPIIRVSPDYYNPLDKKVRIVMMMIIMMGIKICIFLIFNAINQLFHYAHRVGHVILTQVAPQDAQNEPVGSRL